MKVNLRGEVMSLLHRTLSELVNEPPGRRLETERSRSQAWSDVKLLWDLRRAWLKDGMRETDEERDRLNFWYGLLSRMYDPQPATLEEGR